jgi:hypothetical protein
MRATTADWLAGVITTHAETLAASLAQTTPFTSAGEATRLPDNARQYFAALAQTVAEGDMAALRGYLEQCVPRHVQEGGDGGDCIELVNHAEELIEALITQEAADPDQGSDAQRLNRSMGLNARLIVSEVNLQLLINPARYEDAPALLPVRLPTTPAA